MAGFIIFPCLGKRNPGESARFLIHFQDPYPVIPHAPGLGGHQEEISRPVQYAGVGMGNATFSRSFKMFHLYRFPQAAVSPDGKAGHCTALEGGHEQEPVVEGRHRIDRVLPLGIHGIEVFQFSICQDLEGADFMGIPVYRIQMGFVPVKTSQAGLSRVLVMSSSFQLPWSSMAYTEIPLPWAYRRAVVRHPT